MLVDGDVVYCGRADGCIAVCDGRRPTDRDHRVAAKAGTRDFSPPRHPLAC